MDGIKIDKLILAEKDLEQYGIWSNYDLYRKHLFNSSLRDNCVLIQGSAFVYHGKAFLLLGVGGIDYLDSLGHLNEVDGIIGNGNVLFLSKDCSDIYTAHKADELIKCYELEGIHSNINFIEHAPVAPLIFIIRSFKTIEEYNSTKAKVGIIAFEESNTFSGKPIRYSGSLKARLRSKFIAASRVVHCARRPSLSRKECLFDSYKDIYSAINGFRGNFSLIYTLWSQELCNAEGMDNTRKLSNTYNPLDTITPQIVHLAEGALNGS